MGTLFARRRLSLPEMFAIVCILDQAEAVDPARFVDLSRAAVLRFVSDARAIRNDGTAVDLSEFCATRGQFTDSSS